MPGYTPHYSDWTAAANISSGVAVWQNPVYDGRLRSVVDRWVQSIKTYCYNDGSVAQYKPRRGMSNKDWAHYLMWHEGLGLTANIGDHIRRAFAQQHAIKSRFKKWVNSEHQHPGVRYYIDEVIGNTDIRIYTDGYLYTLAKGYYAANPAKPLLHRLYDYCDRKIIDDGVPHEPQYESLWKDGKFSDYLMSVAKAQTCAAVNGFIESKREDRKVQRMKKRAKKGK